MSRCRRSARPLWPAPDGSPLAGRAEPQSRTHQCGLGVVVSKVLEGFSIGGAGTAGTGSEAWAMGRSLLSLAVGVATACLRHRAESRQTVGRRHVSRRVSNPWRFQLHVSTSAFGTLSSLTCPRAMKRDYRLSSATRTSCSSRLRAVLRSGRPKSVRSISCFSWARNAWVELEVRDGSCKRFNQPMVEPS